SLTDSHIQSAKLPRSTSSPSPPIINVSGRTDPARRQLGVRSSKRRFVSSEVFVAAQNDTSHLDLSSTYHAGSSGDDDSGADTSSDDTDRDAPPARGRRTSLKTSRQEVRETVRRKRQQLSPSRRALSPTFADYVAEQAPNGSAAHRHSFTRSRSPHLQPASSSGQGVNAQTSAAAPFVRHKGPPTFYSLLPASVTTQFCVPLSSTTVTFSANSRSLAESLLLFGSLFLANRQLVQASKLPDTSNLSVSLGMVILVLAVTCHDTALPQK
ncbi:hypothetical protein ID866_8253, partial [Astraeus odoratus]